MSDNLVRKVYHASSGQTQPESCKPRNAGIVFVRNTRREKKENGR